MEDKTHSYYERFYACGGWKYDEEKEAAFLTDRILRPLGVTPPARVLDVGCGMGIQTAILSSLGFDAFGVDNSEEGIAYAKKKFPDPTYVCIDAQNMPILENHYDLIFARGLSWYHYELDGLAWVRTQRLFRFLKLGGIFVLYIKTDFSGNKAENGIILNKLDAYTQLFCPLGKIMLCTDGGGKLLRVEEDTVGAEDIIIATQKPFVDTNNAGVFRTNINATQLDKG